MISYSFLLKERIIISFRLLYKILFGLTRMLLMNKMIQKVELKRMEKMEIKKKNKKILLIT
jgi:hypothetical protein